MQRLEKALKNVFDEVGSNYNLPQGEFLNDDFGSNMQFRNPYYGQTPKDVKFAFGTQKELNIWLKDTKDKYPLVWLVYPLKETHSNNANSFYTYPVRLIFAMNNDADKLVQTRLQTTRFVLDQIIEKFEALNRQSKFNKYIYVDKKETITMSFEPNYSTNQQKDGGTIDIWDAVSYDCTIRLIGNCIP